MARQRCLPLRVVERARIVLLAAMAGKTADAHGCTRLRRRQHGAKRFLAGGITALQKDAAA